jgi:glycosyltransferase involved in cell wall biosynthesis
MPWENHHAQLRACVSKRLRIAGARLLLACDGEQRRALEDWARALDLQGLVHFLDVRSDVSSALAPADVSALAYCLEGNPLSVKAMAAGRPTVALAVGCRSVMAPEGPWLLAASFGAGAVEAAMAQGAGNLLLTRTMGRGAAQVTRDCSVSLPLARAYEDLHAHVA